MTCAQALCEACLTPNLTLEHVTGFKVTGIGLGASSRKAQPV